MHHCSLKNLKNKNSREDRLYKLAESPGISFHRPELLSQALVHSSYANEHSQEGVQHNERLEFLGDAVLDLVVSDWLFRLAPEMDEGAMTKARASVVCESSLAAAALSLHLGDYLLLGCGEKSGGAHCRVSILADAFEALAGAIYLDGGLAAVMKFAQIYLGGAVLQAQHGLLVKDYKSQLQEILQKAGPRDIVYELANESGPAHNRSFEVRVYVEGQCLGSGLGKTKKAAEQQAAQAALDKTGENADG